MKKILCAALHGMFSLFLLSACSSLGIPTVHPLPSPIPKAAAGSNALPTSTSPGSEIDYDHLRVAMKQADISSAYLTEYGLKREPTAGRKFLWINILIENIGLSEHGLPSAEHFSVLYGTSEFKPGYGYREGDVDYSTLKPIIYQGQKVDAWLRFEIPADAGLQDLQFAFLPESFQVSFSFPSSGYPWADHPIYLWQCGR